MKQQMAVVFVVGMAAFVGLNVWELSERDRGAQPVAREEIRVEPVSTTVAEPPTATVAAKTPPRPRPTQHRVVTYRTKTPTKLSGRELDCLARNIFHEAGVESREGKIAVAQVTINRRNTGRWGKDVCAVVYSPRQFSWTNDRRLRNSQPRGELWRESQSVAREFQTGVRIRHLEDVTHYHAEYVDPQWNREMKVSHVIGRHLFYSKI